MFFFLILIYSCNEKVIEPPKNLIAQEKMEEILYDLALINAAKSINKSVLETYDIEVMPYIFTKYGIDSIQFVESDIYYASIPEQYEQIYSTVSSRLEKERRLLEEQKQQRQDSIRKTKEEMAKKVKKSGK